MTLNFQNKIVFPAPETSYTTQSAFGQVIYLPRNIMSQVDTALTAKQKYNTTGAKQNQQKPHQNKGANARQQYEVMMQQEIAS